MKVTTEIFIQRLISISESLPDSPWTAKPILLQNALTECLKIYGHAKILHKTFQPEGLDEEFKDLEQGIHSFCMAVHTRNADKMKETYKWVIFLQSNIDDLVVLLEQELTN